MKIVDIQTQILNFLKKGLSRNELISQEPIMIPRWDWYIVSK
jgi:hypothetical protein